MGIENTLDTAHKTVTSNKWLQMFTAFTRILLAIGFIPPSIPKILHKPFTVLPDTNPVGHYFNALYQTGFYYEFIGWGQITAAILLLIPRTAHIGALMFLPIIVNIAVLTSSVGFKGTWLITLLMAFAATWLTAWEYDRLKPIVFRSRESKPERSRMQWLYIPGFFALGGVGMGIIWKLMGLGNFPDYLRITGLLVATGFVFGLIVTLHYRMMPVGKLEMSNDGQSMMNQD